MTEALNQTIMAAVIRAIRLTLFLPDTTPIGLNTRLSEDLMLDSLSIIEVAMSLEETYSTEFPVDLTSRFHSVSDLVVYLSRRYFTDDQNSLRSAA